MINVWTSYYSKISRIANDNMLLIKVSNTQPDWFTQQYYEFDVEVAPPWNLINEYKNNQIDYHTFKLEYEKVLQGRFSPSRLVNDLEILCGMTGTNNVFLLCWEKDGNECHRTALAEFLNLDNRMTYMGEY